MEKTQTQQKQIKADEKQFIQNNYGGLKEKKHIHGCFPILGLLLILIVLMFLTAFIPTNSKLIAEIIILCILVPAILVLIIMKINKFSK